MQQIYIQFVRHENISGELIDEIVSLKNEVWHYPRESHLTWISDNIRPNDIHLILRNGQQTVGYMNLVELCTNIPGYENNSWGVGNVCIHPEFQGQSYGHLLMSLTNHFIFKYKALGILICRDRLVGFYEKCGWHKFYGKCMTTTNVQVENNILTSHKIVIPESELVDCQSKLIIDRIF